MSVVSRAKVVAKKIPQRTVQEREQNHGASAAAIIID